MLYTYRCIHIKNDEHCEGDRIPDYIMGCEKRYKIHKYEELLKNKKWPLQQLYMDLLLNFGDVRCIFVPFEFRLSLCHNQQKDIFYFLPFLDSPITKNGSCLELYFDNDACFLHH